MPLRKRLITVLTFQDGVLFRTKQFTPDYRYTANFIDAWSVDEIVALDVTRTGGGIQTAFLDVVGNLAKSCFVPLAAGGGVRTIEDVRILLDAGADKVIVNTGAIDRPELISEIAYSYGSQCVVVSVDAMRHDSGAYEVCAAHGKRETGMTPTAWAQRATELGAGEIFITSIERDGSLEGYDIALCRQISDAVSVPVLICGGAGNWQHFADGYTEGGADAVCTSNIYHFTEASIRSAKMFLAGRDIPVRA